MEMQINWERNGQSDNLLLHSTKSFDIFFKWQYTRSEFSKYQL